MVWFKLTKKEVLFGVSALIFLRGGFIFKRDSF